jgi:hypothetical protein
MTPGGDALLMDAAGLGQLHGALRGAGYRVIGPTVRDGAITLDELESADDLPFGWGVELRPGGYRLRERADRAAFSNSAGSQSWKQFLHPPREKVWSARRTEDGFEVAAAQEPAPRFAFFGVRPCDLRASTSGPGARHGAPGSAYGTPSRRASHRGELHRAGRDLLLHVDGHRPGSRAGRPGPDRARRRRRTSFLIDIGSIGADAGQRVRPRLPMTRPPGMPGPRSLPQRA